MPNGIGLLVCFGGGRGGKMFNNFVEIKIKVVTLRM